MDEFTTLKKYLVKLLRNNKDHPNIETMKRYYAQLDSFPFELFVMTSRAILYPLHKKNKLDIYISDMSTTLQYEFSEHESRILIHILTKLCNKIY